MAVTRIWDADNAKWQMVGGDVLLASFGPIGEISAWGTNTAPENWLLLDGSNVSRTAYSELFSLWGTSFGAGDGSTTFGLPNAKGRDIIGRDAAQVEFDTLGETGGAKTHVLTAAQQPALTGSFQFHGGASTVLYQATGPAFSEATVGTTYKNATDVAGFRSVSAVNFNNGGSGQAHPILDPYLVLNWIVRAKTGSVIEILPYPRGVLGYAQRTTSQGSITAETVLTGLSVTITIPASRRLRITGHGLPSISGGPSHVHGDIKMDGSVVGRWMQLSIAGDFIELFQGSAIVTPTTGSHTFALYLNRATGSATITNNADVTHPSWILVEDIGAA